MPESFVGVAPDGTGKKLRTVQRTVGANTVDEQYVILGDNRNVACRATVSSFRIPGVTTTPQTLLTLWNGSASKIVDVNRIAVDNYSTVGKAPTVGPSIVRVHRITTAPNTGTTLAPVLMDTVDTQDTGVVVRQAASADGTLTAITNPTFSGSPLTQEVASRLIFNGGTVAAGSAPAVYTAELADRIEFFEGPVDVTVRPGQGIAVYLVGAGLTTDNWTVVVDWDEYTLP